MPQAGPVQPFLFGGGGVGPGDQERLHHGVVHPGGGKVSQGVEVGQAGPAQFQLGVCSHRSASGQCDDAMAAIVPARRGPGYPVIRGIHHHRHPGRSALRPRSGPPGGPRNRICSRSGAPIAEADISGCAAVGYRWSASEHARNRPARYETAANCSEVIDDGWNGRSSVELAVVDMSRLARLCRDQSQPCSPPIRRGA